MCVCVCVCVCVSVVRDLDKEVLHPQRGQDRTGQGWASRVRGDKGSSSFQGGCPHPVQLCGRGSDMGLCTEIPDVCTDTEACGTISLLTEYADSSPGQAVSCSTSFFRFCFRVSSVHLEKDSTLAVVVFFPLGNSAWSHALT